MSESLSTPTAEAPAAAAQEKAAGLRKERVGRVVSTKMQKTCVVETVTRVPHPRFGKIIKHRKRFYVHDEESKAQMGAPGAALHPLTGRAGLASLPRFSKGRAD